jgi:hypothetical protein
MELMQTKIEHLWLTYGIFHSILLRFISSHEIWIKH